MVKLLLQSQSACQYELYVAHCCFQDIVALEKQIKVAEVCHFFEVHRHYTLQCLG